MRAIFHKLTDDRHALEIVRDDGARERVELETRSYLTHDLVHWAVESELRTANGFWGGLAAGKTLAQMNDRSAYGGDEIMKIEGIVGITQSMLKGLRPHELPDGVTEDFIERVTERMRRLQGQWKATRHGTAMELEWPSLS